MGFEYDLAFDRLPEDYYLTPESQYEAGGPCGHVFEAEDDEPARCVYCGEEVR